MMRRSTGHLFDAGAASRLELPPSIGRERRLHARIHAYWISLLGSRLCPSIGDLDPRRMASGADRAALFELDDRQGWRIRYVGRALAEQAGCAMEGTEPGSIDRSSMLGRIVRRLPAVRRFAVPQEFEADHDELGMRRLYRGILLPFADAGGEIRFVYAVASWKLLLTEDVGDDVEAAVASAATCAPRAAAMSPWGEVATPPARIAPASAAERLAEGRTWAALAAVDRAGRGPGLHAALSAVYDLLLLEDRRPGTLRALGVDGVDERLGAPSLALSLVMGAQGRGERAQCLGVIGAARRLRLGSGQVADWLDRLPGGASTAANMEREARRRRRAARPASEPAPLPFLLRPAAIVPDPAKVAPLQLAVG